MDSKRDSNLLVICAFLIKPGAPTESGVAWRWAVAYLSLGYRVRLLTHVSQQPNFANFDLPEGMEIFFLGKKSKINPNPISLTDAIRLWIACRNWSGQCRRFIENFLEQPYFVHHITISSIRLPSPTFNLRARSIWGPLGGGHLGKLRKLGPKELIYELGRNLSIGLFSTFARIAIPCKAKREVLTLGTNKQTIELLKRIGFRKVIFELSDGIEPGTVLRRDRAGNSGAGELNIIWAGRLVESKRPILALETLKELLSRGIPAKLHLAGDGSTQNLETEVKKLGLSNHVEFRGAIPWNELMTELRNYDLSLFTSGRDSSAPFVLESLYSGVACFAIRTEVIRSIFPADVVAGPEEEESTEAATAQDLARSIQDWLHRSPEQRNLIRDRGQKFAENHVWPLKAKRVIEFVDGSQALK